MAEPAKICYAETELQDTATEPMPTSSSSGASFEGAGRALGRGIRSVKDAANKGDWVGKARTGLGTRAVLHMSPLSSFRHCDNVLLMGWQADPDQDMCPDTFPALLLPVPAAPRYLTISRVPHGS